MKKMFIALAAVGLISANAFGAVVNSAKIDDQNKNILIDVTYGGGCKPHAFSLKLQGCLESNPVQCKATLIEDSEGDGCEALIQETIAVSLAKLGLDTPYFNGAYLTIQGDKDFEAGGKPSAVLVQLPFSDKEEQ